MGSCSSVSINATYNFFRRKDDLTEYCFKKGLFAFYVGMNTKFTETIIVFAFFPFCRFRSHVSLEPPWLRRFRPHLRSVLGSDNLVSQLPRAPAGTRTPWILLLKNLYDPIPGYTKEYQYDI